MNSKKQKKKNTKKGQITVIGTHTLIRGDNGKWRVYFQKEKKSGLMNLHFQASWGDYIISTFEYSDKYFPANPMIALLSPDYEDNLSSSKEIPKISMQGSHSKGECLDFVEGSLRIEHWIHARKRIDDRKRKQNKFMGIFTRKY